MLSVSGFPEPLRQASVESDLESSKLRGLFGKKAETRSVDSRPCTRPNTEDSTLSSPPSPSSASAQALPPSDHESYAQMVLSSQMPLPPIPQRPRKVSTPRRPPPQVRKQSSLGRLEIGTSSRAVPGSLIVNALPKPPTPVVESGTRATSPIRRPLPLVPNSAPTVGSSKDAGHRPARAIQRSPPSKVLVSTPSRSRSLTTSPPAVSVRYQPLMVKIDTGEKSSSSSPRTPNGQIRRLPAVPRSAVNPSPPALPHGTLPAHARRPRTNSSPFDSTGRRSPLDSVPSSWASRPVNLNPIPRTPRSPSGRSPSSSRDLPSSRITPRARSYSRSRRDPLMHDPSGSKAPIGASPRQTRVLSPVSLASTSSSSPARTSGWTSRNVTPLTSPISSPVLPPLSPPDANRFLSAHADHSTPSSGIAKKPLTANPHISVNGSSQYSPPERLDNDEHTRDATSSPDIFVEPYIDDEDYVPTMSRSPSPMQYARPNSRGSLSSLSGDSSDYSRSRSRAVRDQLRAYRRSYRGPKSPSRSPSPMQYARRSSVEPLDDLTTGISPRRRPQPRSYQFDYQAAQDSSPFLRAASPERRSCDNDSKASSSKSVSSKKCRGRSKTSKNSRSSRSQSPRWSRFDSPTGSVIDISFQSTLEPQRLACPSLEHKRASKSISDISSRGCIADGPPGGGVRMSRSESQHGSSWKTTAASSWEEVSKAGKKKWINLYKDDNAVVVTAIQRNREVWKGDDVKRIIPKFRGVKVRP